MARRKGPDDSDVETLEAPTEGLPDTTGEEDQGVETSDTLDIRALHEIKIPQLLKIARDLEVENATGMRKQDLIFKILQAQTEKNGLIFAEGVLEILPEGYGFLRSPTTTTCPAPTTSTCRPPRSSASTCAPATPSSRAGPAAQGGRALLRAAARRGDQLREPRGGEGEDPLRQPDAALPAGPAQPRDEERDLTTRIIDLLSPIGKGQRALIVAAAPNRQDDPPAEDRQRHHREPSRGRPHRAADRRAPRRGHRHAALGEGRGHLLHLRRAGGPPRAGGRDGHREGQAAGRAQAATW